MIELSNVKLFDDLTLIKKEDQVIDLHNNYVCNTLKYDDNYKLLEVIFVSREETRSSKVLLVFKKVLIAKFNFLLVNSEDSSTLNTFYRGRFEKENQLFERTIDNEKYFYIEFEKGDFIELFAEEVYLEIITL